MASRNPYFDILKFFAILLVVYGHAAGAFGCEFGRPWLENFIVGMNMPLFFVISGYFAAKTIEDGNWRKLGKHIASYAWPMAVVSVVFAVLAVSFHITGCEVGLIGYAGRRFLFAPWFLWCLAICYIVTFLCRRPKSIVFRGGAFLLLIIVLPLITGVWHVGNVRAMLPFFLFGVFVLRRYEIWKNWRVGLACSVVYVVVTFIQGDIHENGMSFYHEPTTWAAFLSGWKFGVFYLARIVNGIIGSIGVMWVIQVMTDKTQHTKWLAPLGRTTLGVYILHQWFLARIVDQGLCDHSFIVTIVCTILLFLFCHFVVVCTKRFDRLRLAVWGEGVAK